MENIVIIGISDTADRIYQFIQRYSLYNVVGFSVDKEYLPESGTYKGLPCWPLDQLKQHIDIAKDLVFVAVLWNRLNGDRRRMYEHVKAYGFKFASLISPKACFRGRHIGENCLVSDGVIIQEEALIGDDVYLMDGAIVGHRAIIGTHAFLAVGSITLGAARVGEQVFVGAGSIVFDETKIGDKSLVGAGVAVRRDIPPFSVCKINPQENIVKSYSEDVIESKWMAHHNVR